MIVVATKVLSFLSSPQIYKSCSFLSKVHFKYSSELSDHPDPQLPLSLLKILNKY